MKYRGKEYKWFKIMFEDGKPDGVELYENCPWEYRAKDGSILTYWDNELLTEKPIIS
jgi:hypothetical protein